jgi:hypothetical protein
MNRSLGLLVLFLSLSIAGSAHAETVALVPPSGTNIHQGYLDAARDLLRGHLLGTGRYNVVAVPNVSSAQELGALDAGAIAKQVGAEVAVVLHITRLGEAATARLSAYSVHGRLVYSDSLRAASPEDLDVILERLAKGMATGKSAQQTAEIDTVTEKEADPFLKMTATSVFGIKLGGMAPLNTDEVYPGISFFWLYDMRTFLAEIDVGMHTGDDGGDLFVGINAYYPLSRTNTSPYVGGGLRYQFSNYDGIDDRSGTDAGIAAHATVGAIMGRLQSVQLRGDLSYFTTFYNDGGEVAHGLRFGLGLGF